MRAQPSLTLFATLAALVCLGTGPALAAQPAATGKEAAPEGTPQGAAAAVAADLEASAVKALGVVEGKPIDTGFVFFDGRYLDAPYTVSRRGRQVFINDVLVYQWHEWPPMDMHVYEDPGSPTEVYAKATGLDDCFGEDWRKSHFWRKIRYLYEHFSKEVAKQKEVEYLRQLPFVVSAGFEPSPLFPDSPTPDLTTLVLTTKAGKKENVSLGPPRAGTEGHWDFGVKDVRIQVDGGRDMYERYIRAGNALLLFSRNCYKELDREVAARDLPLVLQILRSARPTEEKVNLLQRMKVFPTAPASGKEIYMPLITRFEASPQLDERVAALVKETGVKPRTLQDLPDEIPWDRAERLDKEKREREQRDKEQQKKEQGAREKN